MENEEEKEILDLFEDSEETSKGEQARESVDDWAYLVGALKLNRQA